MEQTKKKSNRKPAKTAKRPASSATSRSASGRKTAPSRARQVRPSRRREAGAVVFFVLAIFAVSGYFAASGVFITYFSDFLRGLIGWGYFVMPPLLFVCAVILAFHRGRPVAGRVTSVLMLAVLVSAFSHLFLSRTAAHPTFSMFKGLWKTGILAESGGIIGGGLSITLTYLLGRGVTMALYLCLAVFFIMVSLNLTLSEIAEFMSRRRELARQRHEEMLAEYAKYEEDRKYTTILPPPEPKRRRKAIDIPLDDFDETSAEPTKAQDDGITMVPEQPEEVPAVEETPTEGDALDVPPFMDTKLTRPIKSDISPEKPQPIQTAEATTEKPKTVKETEKPAYDFPPIDLLAAPESGGEPDMLDEVRQNVERLETAFRSFGVNVSVASFTRGPTVTRYEAELEAGVKLSTITRLSDDIALALGASGVRIAAMPNKRSTVGIEVPNRQVSKVFLREIIDTPQFKNSASKLTFAIGKNIGGEAIVGDISKLLHLLVAGTTGSGKSVCLNSMILSILYKATPDEVRFIMIDPKMVEFQVYNGIPHLLVPVVTDVKKACGALQWAVVEMMKRYRTFADNNARDIASYNKLMLTDGGERMPQIVIVIDELADLMMTARSEVEESICRVAQMGRAAGIHLVIATQSPRADVITGLMKANIPSRIALKVSSSIESRIILDAGGSAEKLVGYGDMLFAPIGASKPLRIQGTWVSDSERESVVKYLKRSGKAQYSEEVIHEIDKAAEGKEESAKDSKDMNEYDEMLVPAVEVIFETGQASVSMLQRRLKLGYARAARIVDQMEQLKIVGPFEGSKPRQILITRQQWHEMQYAQNTAPVGPAEAAPPPADDIEDKPEEFDEEQSGEETAQDEAPF
jgi:S-DNA-T family DNA segregation ATPase FtsK/SpoIIIE